MINRITFLVLLLAIPVALMGATETKRPEWASALPWKDSLETCEIQLAKGVIKATSKHYDLVRVYHPGKGYTYTLFRMKHSKKWEYGGRLKGRMWLDIEVEEETIAQKKK